jgi:hypothetical protein
MSSRHLASQDDDERGRAVDRLRAAVAERRAAREALEAADGSKNAGASASLRAAKDRIAAGDDAKRINRAASSRLP